MTAEKKEFYKKLFALILPIAFQNFMLSLVSASDAFMLGRLHQNAMAAVSLAGQVMFVFHLFLGSMSIGATINKVEELASTLQVAFDAGAKRILMPMSSAADIPTVPSDLFAKFQISFYSSPEDAIVKALGIE